MVFIMRIWGTNIVGEFIGTASEHVINVAHQYLLISTIFYFFLGQIFIYRNALQGMGETFFPFMACLFELFARVFAAIYLSIKFGYIGMFYAVPIAWICASSIMFVGYFGSTKYIILKVKKQIHMKLVENPTTF